MDIKALMAQRKEQDQLFKKFEIDADTVKQLDETGTATARIAVIGIKDHDGDIMAEGAFTEGQTITILPTHQWSAQPLGKGTIRIDGANVLVDMKFNLESQAAKEWHSWLKFDMENGTPIQEWSWGWDWKTLVFESERIDGENVAVWKKVDVIEASPVLRGAGSSTGTVAVKSAKHVTATSIELWSRSDNETRAEGKGEGYAIDGKFLHHFIDEDGTVRAASVKACQDAIAVINGTQGGATVGDESKQAAYDHMAQHIKDAGIEAAPLDLTANSGLKFVDEVDAVIQQAYDLQDAVADLGARVKGVKALRERTGRGLSENKVKQLNEVVDALKSLNLLDVKDEQDPAITEELLSLKAQSIRDDLHLV